MDAIVLYEVAENIAQVTINRPDALNALNESVLLTLDEVFDDIQNNVEVRAVIISGAGNKAFVAGADIAYMQTLTPAAAQCFSQLGHRIMSKIENTNKVVIAAIQGYALGGGCELALACDIRVAAADAQMGIPEVTLGLFPGFGGTQRLPRIVGLGIAKEMLATGRRLSADEALSCGLLNQVVPVEELSDACHDMAARIARNSISAIALGKRCMNSGIETDLAHGLELEASLFGLSFSMPDAREGVDAFVNKRKPNFE